MPTSRPGSPPFRRRFAGALLALLALLATRGGLSAADAPASGTRPAGQLPGYETIRLGRGHYNRLCFAATVEGTQGLMILDTGASTTLLNRDKYRALLPAANRQLPAGTPASVPVNGMKCPVGLARDFRLGRVDLGAAPVVLAERRYFFDAGMLYQQDAERQYDGLLGENLLRRYRAIVDCGRMALYLNTDPARRVDPGHALAQAGWTRVPMDDLGNDFTVPCTVNGHRFRLVVDTGMPFTKFDHDRLAAVQIFARETPLRGGLIGTRATNEGYLRSEQVQVGDYRAPYMEITTTKGLQSYLQTKRDAAGSAPVAGCLGGDFLAHNAAIIDVGNHALYLKGAATSGSRP